jgi:hypothetical protein
MQIDSWSSSLKNCKIEKKIVEFKKTILQLNFLNFQVCSSHWFEKVLVSERMYIINDTMFMNINTPQFFVSCDCTSFIYFLKN